MSTTIILFLFLTTSPLSVQAQQSYPTAAGSSAKHSQTSDPDPSPGKDSPCPQGRNQTNEVQFREYVIRTYRWPEPEACLQISERGRVVYSLESADFKIGGNFQSRSNIPVGTDITGNGIPNAVVGEWSGGIHCCFILHVFELGEKFREIAPIEADHSDQASFSDLNHNGIYEFDGRDWAFAYWRTSFNYSPAPRIVLRYRNGRFRPAFDLMKTADPSTEDFAAMVQSVRSDKEWSLAPDRKNCDEICGVPVALWKNMLDLMYAGHADFAWRLFGESWPSDKKGKGTFAEQFCRQLRSSHYWPEMRPLMGSCPTIANP